MAETLTLHDQERERRHHFSWNYEISKILGFVNMLSTLTFACGTHARCVGQTTQHMQQNNSKQPTPIKIHINLQRTSTENVGKMEGHPCFGTPIPYPGTVSSLSTNTFQLACRLRRYRHSHSAKQRTKCVQLYFVLLENNWPKKKEMFRIFLRISGRFFTSPTLGAFVLPAK